MGALLTKPLCDAIGFVYPAFASFKALESADTADDTQWLTYWIVHSLFSVTESYGRPILSFFPFYHPAKVIFLLWLMLPQTKGARLVYHKLVRPFLVKHQDEIERRLSEAQRMAEAHGKRIAEEALEHSEELKKHAAVVLEKAKAGAALPSQ